MKPLIQGETGLALFIPKSKACPTNVSSLFNNVTYSPAQKKNKNPSSAIAKGFHLTSKIVWS